jgi:hypothetical protein
MTARRAKLSLDSKQHSKSPPPHGFETPAAAGQSASAGEANQAQVQASTEGGAGRPAAGRWEAHRPAPAPESQAGAEPTDPLHEAAPAPSTAAVPAQERALLARAAAIGRHPLVRAAAVGLAAGLSLYLLRRRFF